MNVTCVKTIVYNKNVLMGISSTVMSIMVQFH